jgi:PAS domain-containing protein
MGARLFEDSRDALAIVDSGGRVVSINWECRQLFGEVGDLEPGTKMLENGPSARPSSLSDVVRLAYSERLQRDEVILFRHQHGFEIRLDVRVAPLRCGDDTIGGWLVRARLA